MASRRWRNPVAFRRGPVTFVTIIVYIGLSALVLYGHIVTPRAPKEDVPLQGINIAEAWNDLQTLSSAYRPFNSKRNDEIRNWLLLRIDYILNRNSMPYAVDPGRPLAGPVRDLFPVVVFNDLISNVTLPPSRNNISVYFEGTNIIVYVRGSKDGTDEWWRDSSEEEAASKPRGVLVNAHYDSVSTGLGATDDGVGVVTILQLLQHYTTRGKQPKRGLVLLLNNGEEDYLNGAYAFMQHPISKFPDTFLNLEGAGAGGRAILFRSTDAEVTSYYKRSPRPSGTVVFADGFKRRLVRSETDYVVFHNELGMRGLDVAFFGPRAKYHTMEDSSRWTDRDALWHMLSAALATTKGLTSDTNTKFDGDKGSSPVYFDVLGRGFGLMNLHSMFALSVTLLIVAPLTLIALSLVLRRADKWYLFSTVLKSDPLDPNSPDETTAVRFRGWRGVFRYPLAFGFASAGVVALALLVAKVNPLIIYSSEYAVWSMMLSAWFFIMWFFLRGADYMRPSALHRAHAFGWLFALFWFLMIAVTIAENNLDIASGYFIVIYFAAIFVALMISYLEFFALPKKHDYMETFLQSEEQTQSVATRPRGFSDGSSQIGDPSGSTGSHRRSDHSDEPTETTSLLGRKRKVGNSEQIQRRGQGDDPRPSSQWSGHYGEEQAWSGTLPSWLWIIQFLVCAPIVLVLVGSLALMMVSGLHQTPADGNSVLLIYMLTAVFSIFLLVPVSPFVHRISSRVSYFLFFIFIGTLLYNLLAFPFSEKNKLKVFFQQDLDLDSGVNRVTLTALDGYVQSVIDALPSSTNKQVDCSPRGRSLRRGLRSCSWVGLAPGGGPHNSWIGSGDDSLSTEKRYNSWPKIKTSRANDTSNEAKLEVFCGPSSRSGRIVFDSPLSDFRIEGASDQNDDSNRGRNDGTKEIRLWSREWGNSWYIYVKWNSTADINGETGRSKKQGLDGKGYCLLSDANKKGVIPALDEVMMHMPVWSVVVKHDDGLVFAYKRFMV